MQWNIKAQTEIKMTYTWVYTFFFGCIGSWTWSMTSSNGNIFRVTGLLCEEFTGDRWIPAQRPVTRSFDVFFDLRLNQQMSKRWRRRWFETPSRSLWRHCNENTVMIVFCKTFTSHTYAMMCEHCCHFQENGNAKYEKSDPNHTIICPPNLICHGTSIGLRASVIDGISI